MAREILSLKKLHLVGDGTADRMFQREIAVIVDDILQRPGDSSSRSVTLNLIVTPQDTQKGIVERCRVEFEAFSKVPRQRTAPHEMMPHAQGGLLFRPDEPDDVNQETLSDEMARVAGGKDGR